MKQRKQRRTATAAAATASKLRWSTHRRSGRRPGAAATSCPASTRVFLTDGDLRVPVRRIDGRRRRAADRRLRHLGPAAARPARTACPSCASPGSTGAHRARRHATSPRCTTPAAARSPQEMHFVALREGVDARVRARRGRARPRHHPGQHQPPRARADDHRPQLPGEDQRQHRQLGGHARRSTRRSRSCSWASRWGADTVMDLSTGQEHPRDARVDHPQLAGADRHGADLPGAREGQRQGRGPDHRRLPRDADRAGRAGRRLLHDPRRRAAALRPADRASA